MVRAYGESNDHAGAEPTSIEFKEGCVTEGTRGLRPQRISIVVFTLGACLTFSSFPIFGKTPSSPAQAANSKKSFAQKLLEETLPNHPEITGLEIAATPPNKPCMTIAATEAREVGEKCDKDEFTALKTHKPFVEKEKDEFDVTFPLHDASGKLIGTAGMDFKLTPGLEESTVVDKGQQIVKELEKQIPSKARLFESAQSSNANSVVLRLRVRHISMLISFLSIPLSLCGQGLDTSKIDQVFERSGQKSGDAYKVCFPRTELHVTMEGVVIKPGLALGSWAGFMGSGTDATVMGDLVLLQDELNPLMEKLRKNGFEITGIHNHLINETPHVMYLHYMGHGKATELAESLKDGLGASKTPLGSPAATPA